MLKLTINAVGAGCGGYENDDDSDGSSDDDDVNDDGDNPANRYEKEGFA